MTYRTEFPDFDVATMPEIPSGFVDSSWRNDTCPCFINAAAGLVIFVDYADAALREFADTKRFTLSRYDHETGDEIVSSDNWPEIVDHALAACFAAELRRELGANLTLVNARNAAETESGVCHSHDFCDANVTMAAAFEHVFGRQPDIAAQGDVDTWNRAWAIAKATRFYA